MSGRPKSGPQAAQPGEPGEVRLLGGNGGLQRLERPRLDEDDPVDRSLDRECELTTSRLVVGPKDLDAAEADDRDERTGQHEPRTNAPAGEADADEQDGDQLRGQIAARQGDLEHDRGPATTTPPAATAMRPRGPEHDPERERRDRHTRTGCRPASSARAPVMSSARNGSPTRTSVGTTRSEAEGRQPADDPRPERDRTGGGGLGSPSPGGGLRPAPSQPIAEGNRRAERRGRARRRRAPARPPVDRQPGRPDPEEHGLNASHADGRVPDPSPVRCAAARTSRPPQRSHEDEDEPRCHRSAVVAEPGRQGGTGGAASLTWPCGSRADRNA